MYDSIFIENIYKIWIIKLHNVSLGLFIQEGNYKVALKYYDKCQKNLEFETTLSGEDEEKKKEMILLAHLNMAMCCLKIDQPAKVRDHCNKALELDDKCVKAYFRRGQVSFWSLIYLTICEFIYIALLHNTVQFNRSEVKKIW